MDFVDVKKAIKVLELYKQIVSFDKNESVIVNDRIKELEESIQKHNIDNCIVENANRREVGNIRGAIVGILIHKYVNKETKRKEMNRQTNLIKSIFSSYDIPKHLLDAKVILKRKFKHYYNYDKFGHQLNQNINLQIEMDFISKNPQIIELNHSSQSAKTSGVNA